MKEFFAWYMIASIIGVWSILAYGFYRMSKMAGYVSSLQKTVLDLSVSRIVMNGKIQALQMDRGYMKQGEKGSAND